MNALPRVAYMMGPLIHKEGSYLVEMRLLIFEWPI